MQCPASSATPTTATMRRPLEILSATLLLSPLIVLAAEGQGEPAPYVTKGFVIVRSTQSYAEALRGLGEMAVSTGIRVDLRGVGYQRGQSPQSGDLTFAPSTCKELGWGYPCYVARGRFDDGIYLSLEYSDAFEGFAEGHYIVVAASGSKARRVLKTLRKHVPDAYFKRTRVYVGCMH